MKSKFFMLIKNNDRIAVIKSNCKRLTKGGKKGMNDGKLGSSFSCSSFKIPSSALLILCCILSLRTYKIRGCCLRKGLPRE